ncbi:SucC succinyl-CoA synthetase subunit beta [Candidatus Phycorickettsia trachydisci]|uniref:Succinate--CoA ligase [ADP-forming] subunit beta n=1 Tax=Candidatus Phycorickettsia trachydisci TaxID=2115978 RepID=A0A2P1P9V4_9RICK|nr:ADP-forming succinate--CoA ligase subunit beta [Candidatus Phycorickettsia trachydisci]AVP88025.1 SucC succinyl-CoA synthetase subunit beta [Candidatus Phycorickettsia trachydisci]
MNIHEYQAKQLLAASGLRILPGVAITSQDQIKPTIESFDSDMYVVKAQVHSGGRGKAGGIIVAKNKKEAVEACNKLWNKTLVTKQSGPKGKLISKLYIEGSCSIVHEYYCSMLIDRSKNLISIIISQEGGMDIEEVASKSPEKIFTVNIDPLIGISSFIYRKITLMLGLPVSMISEVKQTIGGIYSLFMQKDASLIEINPLVLTSDDKLVVLDAKIGFDENGLFRHKDILDLKDPTQEDPLEIKAAQLGISYVKMDGNIGCMVNGAGLAMATMDLIKLKGGSPANFLDVGGGADKNKVAEAFKIILSDTAVKGVLVNIFGGILRCDVIAEGIIAATKELKINVPLVVRLAGTNFEQGNKILDNAGLNIHSASDLNEAASKIVSLSNSSIS